MNLKQAIIKAIILITQVLFFLTVHKSFLKWLFLIFYSSEMPKGPVVYIQCQLWYDAESREGVHLSHIASAAAIAELVPPVPLIAWVF